MNYISAYHHMLEAVVVLAAQLEQQQEDVTAAQLAATLQRLIAESEELRVGQGLLPPTHKAPRSGSTTR